MAAQSQEVPRQSFQEALAITPLPASQDGHGRLVKRYMSQQPAWKPGDDLPWEALFSSLDGPRPKHGGPGVFGGHVYAQAPLCAARAVEEEEEQQLVTSSKPQGKLGIHVSSSCPIGLSVRPNLSFIVHPGRLHGAWSQGPAFRLRGRTALQWTFILCPHRECPSDEGAFNRTSGSIPSIRRRTPSQGCLLQLHHHIQAVPSHSR